MKWLYDDTDDLVNLDKIEAITLAPIGEEEEGPEGDTHQLLALNSHQESYRLFSGTEEECKKVRTDIGENLGALKIGVHI